MGVNYPPPIVPIIKEEKISTITATASSPAILGETARLGGGYVENKANRAVWVKWSDPNLGLPMVAGDPFTLVPAGGNVDIPEGYMGAIVMLWATGVATTGKAYIHEFI